MNASDAEREAELAGGEIDGDDLAALSSIRAYFEENDPVPAGLVERIQFEITLDALHAELATLMKLDPAGAGARGTSTEAVRTVTFTSESLTTMVTITRQPDDTVRVDGWATPGAGVRVQVLLAGGPHETVADDDGRFVFEGLPGGLAKFSLRVPKGDDFSTVLSPTIEL